MAEVRLVWDAELDERTTLICEDAHGQTVLQDELFVTLIGAIEGPPAHWNCRSVVDYQSYTRRELTAKDPQHSGAQYDRARRKEGSRAIRNKQKELGKERYAKLLERSRNTAVPPDVPVLHGVRAGDPSRRLPAQFTGERGAIGADRPPRIDEVRMSLGPQQEAFAQGERLSRQMRDWTSKHYDVKPWSGSADEMRWWKEVNEKMFEELGNRMATQVSESEVKAFVDEMIARGLDGSGKNMMSGVQYASPTSTHDLAVRYITEAWAESSNDMNPLSLALQERAAPMVGGQWNNEWLIRNVRGELIPEAQAMLREAASLSVAHGKVIDSFLVSSYQQTQMMFDSLGTKRVVLWRGGDFPSIPSRGGRIEMNPLTSFSERGAYAVEFGDDLISVESSIRRVISSSYTGLGHWDAHELVVSGGGFENVTRAAGSFRG